MPSALTIHEAKEQRWDAQLRRVYRRTRSHSARIIIGVAAAYLLAFQTNLLWWAAEPLREDRLPSAANAIVVFAGGVGESGQAGGGQQERLKQAIDLYKAGYSDRLVISSGFVYSFKEAESMRAVAIDQGIPADRIEIEPRARNTYENVAFVQQILDRHQWNKILLVSSPVPHAPRADGLEQGRSRDHRHSDAAAERAVLRAHPRRHPGADSRHPLGVPRHRLLLVERLAVGA